MRSAGKKPAVRILLAAVAVLALAVNFYSDYRRTAPETGGDDAERIRAAFEAGRSDVWVQGDGIVERVLGDDNDGSAHQRFVLRLSSDHTVLIAHNIDLAPRVPLREGDRVSFRGEYEYNSRGGVVHWTHMDPANHHDGGWLRHHGTIYR